MTKRILITGSGAAATRHVKLSSSIYPNAHIAVWRRSPSKAGDSDGFTEVFNEVQALDFNADIAIVAAPATFHLDQAKILVENGVPVLIEKPLSISSDGVVELFDAALAASVVVQVGYNLRFSEGLRHLKELVDSGQLGKLERVKISVDQFLPDWRPEVDYKATASARKSLGGGALLELSHEIDYAIRLFGPFSISHATLEKVSELDIDVEDTVDVTGKLSGRSNGEPFIGIHLGMANRATARYCEVSGSDGSARWDGIRGTLETSSPSDQLWRVVFSNPEDIKKTYEKQLAAFIRDSQSPFSLEQHNSTKHHELQVLGVLDAIRGLGAVSLEGVRS